MQGRHSQPHDRDPRRESPRNRGGKGPRAVVATALATMIGLAWALPAGAWAVQPCEETYGIGIRFHEGQWSGLLVVPTSNSTVGRDKVQHALAGAVIATAFRLTGSDASTALGAALLAGTMKEIGDSGRIPGVPRGHMEIGDWVATGLGGLMAVWATQRESRTLSGPASARDGT